MQYILGICLDVARRFVGCSAVAFGLISLLIAADRWHHRLFNRLHLVDVTRVNQSNCERELAKPSLIRLLLYPSLSTKIVLMR